MRTPRSKLHPPKKGVGVHIGPSRRSYWALLGPRLVAVLLSLRTKRASSRSAPSILNFLGPSRVEAFSLLGASSVLYLQAPGDQSMSRSGLMFPTLVFQFCCFYLRDRASGSAIMARCGHVRMTRAACGGICPGGRWLDLLVEARRSVVAGLGSRAILVQMCCSDWRWLDQSCHITRRESQNTRPPAKSGKPLLYTLVGSAERCFSACTAARSDA